MEQNKADLGQDLENYCNSTHPEYDEQFHEHLYFIRPDWFADGALPLPRFGAVNHSDKYN